MATLRELADLADTISGPMPNSRGRQYSTFTVPGMEGPATRDTLHRLGLFQIPNDLTGRTALDLGCNTGAVSLELARRGAQVIGVELDPDRVRLANEIAKLTSLPARFIAWDLRNGPPPEIHHRRFDITLAWAIDGYLGPSIYRTASHLTSGILYLESNAPRHLSRDLPNEIATVKRHLADLFHMTQYIGQSSPGERRLFFASKAHHHMPRSTSTQEGQHYVKRFTCWDEWDKVRHLTARLADMPDVPPMDFTTPLELRSRAIEGQTWYQADRRHLPAWRRQIVSFVRRLHARGLAHRDLHLRNLVFHGDTFHVIDWEWVSTEHQPLHRAYDLVGPADYQYDPICNLIGPQFVFSPHGVEIIGPAFGLTLGDFINKEPGRIPLL